MSLTVKYSTLLLGAFLTVTTLAAGQSTVTYTDRRGDQVTDTRSLQNGVYTNDKTVTTATGKTYTKNKTDHLNANGRLVTSDTRTGPNGKSLTTTTNHGRYARTTVVTGPKGGSRVYRRPK